jgi:hypothetical protein
MRLTNSHSLYFIWVWVSYCDRRSVGQSILEYITRLGLKTEFLLLSDRCGFVDVGRSLSDERAGLSFTIAGGPRQSSHFPVRLPWDSWPYFTVSDSRFPFPSPPTIRRVTVEVFDPASTQGSGKLLSFYNVARTEYRTLSPTVRVSVVNRMPLLIFVVAETDVCVPLPSKLTYASAAIPGFKPCFPSRCLAGVICVTISWNSSFLFTQYSKLHTYKTRKLEDW